jgi:hypothetical protein
VTNLLHLSKSIAPIMLALGATGLLGCATFFYESNLQTLSPGWTKSQFFEYFDHAKAERPVVRAAKSEGGTVTEVITLRLIRSRSTEPTDYWFVFQDGTLRRWGRPEDWGTVAATYDINFNPAPRVRQ